MNFVELCLTAQFHWEPVEPDGSTCYLCGDRCFLKMFRLLAKIEEIKTIIDTHAIICESCRKIGE